MHPSQCAFCRHDNPAKAKFCNECGSPLNMALCACGAVNEVTDAQCHKCGAPLESARSPASATDPEWTVDGLEARLQELERDLKDMPKPEQSPARPEALRGSKHSPAASERELGSPLRLVGGASPTARGSAQGEPRGFMREPSGVGARGTRRAGRQP